MGTYWAPLCIVLASVKAEDAEPIITDRPDFTESAVVVNRRSLQIENGVSWDDVDGERSSQLPETLVRYGIADRLEARLELPNYVTTTGSSGWGATALGFKWQVGPTASGIDVAWIAMVGLPSGSIDQGIRHLEPSLSLCLSKELSDRLSIAGMLSGAWPEVNGSRTSVFSPTLSFGYAVSDKVGLFLEYAGTYAAQAQPENLLHAGVTYKPQPNLQWDIHAAVRLDRGTHRTLIGIGLSYRF